MTAAAAAALDPSTSIREERKEGRKEGSEEEMKGGKEGRYVTPRECERGFATSNRKIGFHVTPNSILAEAALRPRSLPRSLGQRRVASADRPVVQN